MRNWRKKPRTFNPNEAWSQEKGLCKIATAIEIAWLSTVETLKTDPLEFFRQVLHVEPTDYQKELIELFQKNQFVADRWSRQSGKSFTTSGILLIRQASRNLGASPRTQRTIKTWDFGEDSQAAPR